MANAMIVGLVPWLRYVIFTDRLLEEFSEDEIEAVFGHEIGHVRHQHMPYYLGFLALSLGALGLLADHVLLPALDRLGGDIAPLCPGVASESVAGLFGPGRRPRAGPGRGPPAGVPVHRVRLPLAQLRAPGRRVRLPGRLRGSARRLAVLPVGHRHLHPRPGEGRLGQRHQPGQAGVLPVVAARLDRPAGRVPRAGEPRTPRSRRASSAGSASSSGASSSCWGRCWR